MDALLHRLPRVEEAPQACDKCCCRAGRARRLYRFATHDALSFKLNSAAGFTAVLTLNLAKVESFYKTRHAILQQRVNVLHEHYRITDSTALDNANRVELEDLTAAFVELRDAFKQLQWYELVNFNKIVSRLGKFRRELSWPPGTNDFRIPDTHLATQKECLKDQGHVTDWLARLESKRLEASYALAKTLLLQQKYYGELLPSLLWDSASSAIDQDDVLSLDQVLERSPKDRDTDERIPQRLLFALLHISTLNGSRRCTEGLLSRIASLEDFGYCLHWLVIETGRRMTLQGRQYQVRDAPEIMAMSVFVKEAIDQLVRVICRLGFKLRAFLHEKDSFGRLPLHYAVQYGLFEVCEQILQYMKGHKAAQAHPSITSSPALLPDSEGLTALNLAVLAGNAAITELLLTDYYHSKGAGPSTDPSHKGALPPNLLTTAIKLNCFAIAQLLHASVIDVNNKDYNDETALYLAVRSGRLENVTMLLKAPDRNDKIDLDAREVVYGWTPLILACVKGDVTVMELLLRAGADPKVLDLSGWTAKDHAAFRGWLPIARTLMALDIGNAKQSSPINGLQRNEPRIRKAKPSFDHPVYSSQDIPPGYSEIYVNLGQLDTYNPVTAVNLGPYVSPDAYTPQREADFHVEIRAIDGDQSNHVIQLPVLEDMANKPWRFLTKDPRNFKLAFNIFHATTTTHRGSRLIGSAVALLESLKQGLGSKRESLVRDFNIPILQKDTLDFIGTVTFYFVINTPFPHPHPMPGVEQEFGTHDGPTIIGHRGIL